MAFGRPVETLGIVRSARDDGSARAAAAAEAARRQARLDSARDRVAGTAVSRPEDSSPAIRRLLGHDQPKGPPRRWEIGAGFRSDGTFGLKYVEVGDGPPVAGARRVAAP